jgi:hypothetical protein
MTKQKATFQGPSYVPHKPHDFWDGSSAKDAPIVGKVLFSPERVSRITGASTNLTTNEITSAFHGLAIGDQVSFYEVSAGSGLDGESYTVSSLNGTDSFKVQVVGGVGDVDIKATETGVTIVYEIKQNVIKFDWSYMGRGTVTSPEGKGWIASLGSLLNTNEKIVFRVPEYTAINSTNIAPGQVYYVVGGDSTAAGFRISTTEGGLAFDTGDSNGAYLEFDRLEATFVEPSSHYLMDISYRVKSAGASISSSSSSTTTKETLPKYDVWYRFCKDNSPYHTDIEKYASDWIFHSTTSDTKIASQTYQTEGFTFEGYNYVQFMVSGRDNGFTPYFPLPGAVSITTGDFLLDDLPAESGGPHWPYGVWLRHPNDTQALFVSIPTLISR